MIFSQVLLTGLFISFILGIFIFQLLISLLLRTLSLTGGLDLDYFCIQHILKLMWQDTIHWDMKVFFKSYYSQIMPWKMYVGKVNAQICPLWSSSE